MGNLQISAIDDNSNIALSSTMYDDEEDATEATMIGVNVDGNADEVAIVVGELMVQTHHFGGECKCCHVYLFFLRPDFGSFIVQIVYNKQQSTFK